MRDLTLGVTGALVGHFFLLSVPLVGLHGQEEWAPAAQPDRVTIRFAPKPQPAPKVMLPDPKQLIRQLEQPPEEVAAEPAPPRTKEVVALEKSVGAGSVEQPVQAVPDQVVAMATVVDHENQQVEEVGLSSSGAEAGKEALSLAIYRASPRYPVLARKRGWQGTVLLELIIEADGSVTMLEVHNGSGHRILDQAALEAVRKWLFQPLRKKGVAVASRQLLPVTFKLEN